MVRKIGVWPVRADKRPRLSIFIDGLGSLSAMSGKIPDFQSPVP
jgi:hypothetical protein